MDLGIVSAIYLGVALGLLLISLIMLVLADDAAERKVFARALILSPVWPLALTYWVFYWAGYGVGWTWKQAEFFPRKKERKQL